MRIEGDAFAFTEDGQLAHNPGLRGDCPLKKG